MKIKVVCTDPHSPQGTFEFDEKLAKQLVTRPHYSYVNAGTVTPEGKIVKKKKEAGDD